MKFITILFILIISLITGYSQNERKAEKSALKCIDSILANADKDIDYILTSSMEYSDLVFNIDIEKFEKKKQEVD